MSTTSSRAIERAIEQVYADDWARLVAALVRTTRDLDAAEDALQDAITRAIHTWPRDGIPTNPAGWIATTARNIIIDGARRSAVSRAKLPLLLIQDDPEPDLHAIDLAFQDDRLRLIFTCCHPVLSPESRLALTLRMICGLTTAEIARLFLVPEPTMAARITRAKKKLAASGVPYRIPLATDIPQRLADVLAVIYLIATEGHTASEGEGLHRANHMELALKLSGIMTELVPNHPEVNALRALILFADARKHSRVDAAGNALTLEAMDRSLWDEDSILQAKHLTEQSLRASTPDTVGPYTIQAAIAAIHADAATYEATDWDQIVAFYTLLEHRAPSPVVRLGKAIAVAMRDRPEIGLRLLDESDLDTVLGNYPMLHAARADLYRRAGDIDCAIPQYRAAAALTGNETLRNWFNRQAEMLAGERGQGR